MAVVTVQQVLSMPIMRAAGPEILASHSNLGGDVRWVHSTELADIAPLLRGRDLLLSTGIALPESDHDLRTFALSLADSDAAGLVIELGRRWSTVPRALVRACDDIGLPLVALAREVPFAAVAQQVGERIVDEQLRELREAQRVHDTFTELSIAEAGPRQILEAVQRLAGAAVVLETAENQIIDYRTGEDDAAAVLANWAERSRAVRGDGRTHWDAQQGWLVTVVGRRERKWGRLVVQATSEPTQRLVAVAERAAAALALHRLHDRHRDSVARRTHYELLRGLLDDPTNRETHRRCEIAGLPINHRLFVGLTIRPLVEARGSAGAPANLVEDLISTSVRAAHDLRVPALVCDVDGDISVLLSLARSSRAKATVEAFASKVHMRHPALIAAGRLADKVDEADRTLRESGQVVSAVRSGSEPPRLHRLEDVHLRGLLTLLRGDERLQLFVDRELKSIREHDQRYGADLLGTLRALLAHPSSKSDAASSAHLSRASFYDRCVKIERVLGERLDDPEIRTALHVALMAQDLFDRPE